MTDLNTIRTRVVAATDGYGVDLGPDVMGEVFFISHNVSVHVGITDPRGHSEMTIDGADADLTVKLAKAVTQMIAEHHAPKNATGHLQAAAAAITARRPDYAATPSRVGDFDALLLNSRYHTLAIVRCENNWELAIQHPADHPGEWTHRADLIGTHATGRQLAEAVLCELADLD